MAATKSDVGIDSVHAPTGASPPTAPPPGRMTRIDEVAYATFTSWAIIGLFLDGWSHRNDKPDTFFSPWHGLLYSGIGAAIAWFTIMEPLRHAKAGAGLTASLTPDRASKVAPSKLTGFGLLFLVAGGVGDGIWHEIFGIEAGIDALLSPTHLLLMVGGILALIGPLADAWVGATDTAPTFRDFAPRLTSLVITTALVGFFFMYASAFTPDTLASPAPHPPTEDAVELWATAGFMAVLVTTALLLAPILIARRRWVLPRGAYAVMIIGPSAFMTMLEGIDTVELLVAAVVAGVVAEVVAPRSIRAFAMFTPVAFWATWYLIVTATTGAVWHAEFVGATFVFTPLLGAVLALLAFPPSAPAGVVTPAPTR